MKNSVRSSLHDKNKITPKQKAKNRWAIPITTGVNINMCRDKRRRVQNQTDTLLFKRFDRLPETVGTVIAWAMGMNSLIVVHHDMFHCNNGATPLLVQVCDK